MFGISTQCVSGFFLSRHPGVVLQSALPTITIVLTGVLTQKLTSEKYNSELIKHYKTLEFTGPKMFPSTLKQSENIYRMSYFSFLMK